MALPVTFAGLSTVPLSNLDLNFAALGALTAIPCGVAGTNALALTPQANTPTIAAYVNYQSFIGVAAAANTGGTTATVSGLSALSVFKDTQGGPVALAGGEIAAGNIISLTYDSAMNTGAGGFHLAILAQYTQYPQGAVNTVSSATGVTLTAAEVTGNGTGLGIIARTGAAGGGISDTTPTAAQLLAAMPGAVVGTTFKFLSSNTTGQTQTLLGGTNVTVAGTATIGTSTTRTFEGIVTSISGAGAITMYG